MTVSHLFVLWHTFLLSLCLKPLTLEYSGGILCPPPLHFFIAISKVEIRSERYFMLLSPNKLRTCWWKPNSKLSSVWLETKLWSWQFRKKKVFHRDICDFQNVTFLFEEIERKNSNALDLSFLNVKYHDKKWHQSGQKTDFSENFRKLRRNGTTYQNFWVKSKEGINSTLLICR